MRLAFVVQRYGLEMAGGAEYHCRLVAERLARHARVDVLTTCATDYLTWDNREPEGRSELHGVEVHRFPVERPRNPERFAALTASVFGEAARTEPGRVDAARARRASMVEAEQWLEEQGPFSPRLVRHVEASRDHYDAFVFFSYRYYPTCRGLLAVASKALLVPTAEDDGTYHLPLYPPLFRAPRAIAFNSVEEREMLVRAMGPDLAAGDVVGVGTELPESRDGARFRRRHGIDGPFLLYVGRVDLNKGCPDLFEHFLRYRRETGSSLRLALLGRSVLEIPRDPGLISLGHQPDSVKWDAFDACLAFVMPSRFESLSMATLEAWWAERPVLVNARCDVLRGQCKRSNAGLYYSGYEEFEAALALLEEDEALRARLGRHGRAYFEAHYSWPIIEGKYLALLEPIVGADSRRTA
jgi:glycosyltransferase involved in cell wall biosynthesis